MYRENEGRETSGAVGPAAGTAGRSAGRYGRFGGQYVAETLVEPLAELERAFVSCGQDAAFAAELARLLSTHVGRPTPLYFAAGLSAHAGGGRIYLKREDLTH